MPTPLDTWNDSWSARTANNTRRILKATIVDLSAAVALLIVAEVVLCVVGYGPTRPVRVGRNEFGYREKSFSAEKHAGDIRMLALGDSTTFGTGLSWRETYPKQLQALSQKTWPGRDVLVVNAGGESSCLRDAWEKLDKNCRRVRPEVVVLLLAPPTVAIQNLENSKAASGSAAADPAAWTQSWRLRAKTLPVRVHSWIHGRLRTYQLVQHEIRFAFYRLGLMREDLAKYKGAIFAYAFDVGPGSDDRRRQTEEAYRSMECYLVKVNDYLATRGIRLYVPAIPSRFMLSDLFVDNFRRVDKDKIRIDPYARFERMCRRHGIPFVSVKPRLTALRREMMDGAIPWDDLYIPDDYTHLSATGNQVVAEAVLERLEEDELMTARPASRRRL
jgi:lysophospholipase L1-like esterase